MSMADDQGLGDLHDGAFARQTTGQAVKALLQRTGPDTKGLPVLNAPPANPVDGDLALADGTDWDPDADGIAGYELVIYANGAWSEIIGGL